MKRVISDGSVVRRRRRGRSGDGASRVTHKAPASTLEGAPVASFARSAAAGRLARGVQPPVLFMKKARLARTPLVSAAAGAALLAGCGDNASSPLRDANPPDTLAPELNVLP